MPDVLSSNLTVFYTTDVFKLEDLFVRRIHLLKIFEVVHKVGIHNGGLINCLQAYLFIVTLLMFRLPKASGQFFVLIDKEGLIKNFYRL